MPAKSAGTRLIAGSLRIEGWLDAESLGGDGGCWARVRKQTDGSSDSTRARQQRRTRRLGVQPSSLACGKYAISNMHARPVAGIGTLRAHPRRPMSMTRCIEKIDLAGSASEIKCS